MSDAPAGARRVSPLRSVWFRPGETIARIAHDNPDHRLLAWPILAGCGTLPTLALADADAFEFRFGVVLAILYTPGPVANLLTVFIGAYLVRATGRLLGGRAGAASLRTAFVWSQVPIVVLAAMSIVVALSADAFAELVAADNDWWQDPFWQTTSVVLSVVQAALILWSLCILVAGLASIQRISLPKATANLVLAWLVYAVVIALAVVAAADLDTLATVFTAGLEDLAP